MDSSVTLNGLGWSFWALAGLFTNVDVVDRKTLQASLAFFAAHFGLFWPFRSFLQMLIMLIYILTLTIFSSHNGLYWPFL